MFPAMFASKRDERTFRQRFQRRLCANAIHLWHLGRKLCSLTARIYVVSAKTAWLDSTRSQLLSTARHVRTLCIHIRSTIHTELNRVGPFQVRRGSSHERFRIACVFATKYVPDRPAAALRSPSITVSCPISCSSCALALSWFHRSQSHLACSVGCRERERERSYTHVTRCA